MSGYSEKELLDAGMIEITDEKCEQILASLDEALMKSSAKENPFTPKLSDRRGTIKITHGLLRESQGLLHELFGRFQFIPYRVESMFAEDHIEMNGYSPLFDVVLEGFKSPEYILKPTVSNEGELIDLSVVRRESS